MCGSVAGRLLLLAALLLLLIPCRLGAQSSPYRFPFAFIENRGQWNPRGAYMLDAGGMRVWFDRGAVLYDLKGAGERGHVLRQRFVGARNPFPEGAERLPGAWSFIGSRRHEAGIGGFAEVRYAGLYPGVDARYHQGDGGLKYDLIVGPGGDPSRIRFRYDGALSMAISPDGGLRVGTSVGELLEGAPYSYQEVDGVRRRVDCRFMQDERGVGFQLGEYDRSLPLVIDPALIYSSYLGGAAADDGRGITLDAGGHVYVTGSTRSENFPTSIGAYRTQIDPANPAVPSEDIFVAKFDPTGTILLYGTYINASREDRPVGIAVRSDGVAVIVGATASADFPVTAGGHDTSAGGGYDGFLLGLSPGGDSIRFATFLGGAGDDRIESLALSAREDIVVAGWTTSADFPVTSGIPLHGGKEGFITRLDPSASLIRSSTYLGGSADEEILAVSVDSGGSVWVTGWTGSADFPSDTLFGSSGGGMHDCFITGLRPDLASTYYSMIAGGTGNDEGRALSLRARTDIGARADTIYVTGFTSSGDFPVEPPSLSGRSGSWIALKVLWNGLTLRPTLLYSRYLGTPNGGGGYTVQGDREGRAFLAGTVRSVRSDLDLHLVRLDPFGQEVLPSRTIGGISDEIPWRQSFLTSFGDLYLTGTTWSRDLPVTLGAFDRTLNDNGGLERDAFMLRYAFFSRPAIYAAPLRNLGTLRCSADRLDTFQVYNLGQEPLAIRNQYFFKDNGFTLLEPDIDAAPVIAPGDSLRYIVRYRPGLAGADSNRLLIFSSDELPGRKPLEIRYAVVNQVLGADSATVSFGGVQFCAGGGGTKTLPLTIGLTPESRAEVELRFRSAPSARSFRFDGPSRFMIDGSRRIDIIFEPKGAGVFTDTLLAVVTGNGCRDTLKVPLEGRGDTVSFMLAESELRFPPISGCADSIEFVDTAFTVVNTGPLPITVIAVELDRSEITLPGAPPFPVPVGSSLRIPIRFRPQQRPDTVYDYPRIRIRECNLTRTLPLFAEVRDEGRPSVAPELDFGVLSGCADSLPWADSALRIRNRNETAVAIDTIIIDSPAGSGPFILRDAPAFPLPIPPSETIELPLRYAPVDTGRDSARALVIYRTGRCTDTIAVTLRGAQQAERVEAAEPTIEIPPLPECAGGHVTPVELRNLSDMPVRIIAVLRSDGVDAAAGSLQVPFTIPAGGSITDTALFAPRHAGAALEQITYITALCGDSIVVTLRGSRRGVVLAFAADTLLFPPSLSCQSGPRFDSITLANNGDQGTVATVISATVRGGDGAFTLRGNPVGTTIAAGEEIAIPVEFNPAGAGSYRAILEVRFDPCDRIIELPLVADVSEPLLEVHGGEFGEVEVGSSAITRVTVINRNPMPVLLRELAGVVPPFAVGGGDQLPTSLAPGDSVSLEIRFAPEFEGTFGPTARAEATEPCLFFGNVPLSGIAVATADSVRFCLDGFYSGGAGDTVEVLLHAEKSVPLPAEGTYHIRYDWRRLQLLGVGGASSISDPIVRRGEGIASFSQPAGSLTGEIRIRFRLLAGEGNQTRVHLDSIVLLSGDLAPSVCDDSALLFINDGCLLTGVYLGKFRNALEDARPNPAERWVEITYQQLEDARALLRVFDAGGREVLRPLDALMPGGRYTIGFSVEELPSGSYYYSIEAGSYSQARRMIVER